MTTGIFSDIHMGFLFNASEVHLPCLGWLGSQDVAALWWQLPSPDPNVESPGGWLASASCVQPSSERGFDPGGCTFFLPKYLSPGNC